MKKSKIILAHLVSLAVFVATMLLASLIGRDKLEDKAFDAAALETDVIKKSTNLVVLSYEWIFNSFLCGFCYFMEYPMGTPEDYQCIIPQEELEKMDKNFIDRRLKSFLSSSIGFHSITFIINPGIIPSFPDGYAPRLTVQGGSIANLLDSSDVFSSGLYNRVSSASRSLSFEYQNENRPSNVWTIGIPIFNEGRELIGECWAEVKADYFSEILSLFQSSEDREVALISRKMTVLASSDPSFNGKNITTILEEKDPEHTMEGWKEQVEQSILSATDATFRHNYYGSESSTYVRNLKGSPFAIVVVKSLTEISRVVNKFSMQFYITAIISLIFLALCLRYIFVAFSRENERNRKMESELDVASSIQKRILPKNISTDQYEVFGFQKQARSVGGDLYDYFFQEGKLHFCIGDVSGKGVPASLVMTELCSLYRFIAKRADKAVDIISTLNDAVMEHSDDSMICTLLVGILDLKTGELDYCNAGHTPPVFIKSDACPVFMEIKANMPIYAFRGYPYKSGTLNMSAGDRLFLYTDGVTEARNTGMYLFGSGATLSSVRKNSVGNLEELVSGILEEISSFTQKAEQNDDMTIMCIEYKG